MVREAEAHAADDKTKRELAEVRNELDSRVYQTERTLSEHGGSLDADARGAIETALADAKKALEGQDAGQMRSASEALSRAAHKLAEAMYSKASKPEAGGGASTQDGQSSDKGKEDVVEAEFEEVKE